MSKDKVAEWWLLCLKTRCVSIGCRWACLLPIVIALYGYRSKPLLLFLPSSSFQYENKRVQCTTGALAALETLTKTKCLLSLVYTSAPNSSQTAQEWFANQMRACVDGTASLR